MGCSWGDGRPCPALPCTGDPHRGSWARTFVGSFQPNRFYSTSPVVDGHSQARTCRGAAPGSPVPGGLSMPPTHNGGARAPAPPRHASSPRAKRVQAAAGCWGLQRTACLQACRHEVTGRRRPARRFLLPWHHKALTASMGPSEPCVQFRFTHAQSRSRCWGLLRTHFFCYHLKLQCSFLKKKKKDSPAHPPVTSLLPGERLYLRTCILKEKCTLSVQEAPNPPLTDPQWGLTLREAWFC